LRLRLRLISPAIGVLKTKGPRDESEVR
jgi:hypothetical protein